MSKITINNKRTLNTLSSYSNEVKLREHLKQKMFNDENFMALTSIMPSDIDSSSKFMRLLKENPRLEEMFNELSRKYKLGLVAIGCLCFFEKKEIKRLKEGHNYTVEFD